MFENKTTHKVPPYPKFSTKHIKYFFTITVDFLGCLNNSKLYILHNKWITRAWESWTTQFSTSVSISLQDRQLLASSRSSRNSFSKVCKSSISPLLVHFKRLSDLQTIKFTIKFRIKVSSLISLFKDFFVDLSWAHCPLLEALRIANINPSLQIAIYTLASLLLCQETLFFHFLSIIYEGDNLILSQSIKSISALHPFSFHRVRSC